MGEVRSTFIFTRGQFVSAVSFFGFTKKIIIQGDVVSAAVKQVKLTEYCVYCSDGTYC